MRSGWLGVGLALLLAVWPNRVAAHNPAMSLSPGFGPIGTLVAVSVTGFDPDRDADVFWNQEEIGAFHIGPDGSGSLAFSVPADATPNSYQVLVLCMTCQPPLGERADAWFEVVAGESTPTPTGLLPTATYTPMPPTLTAPATATYTCGLLGNCTATPTLTSLPTATPTSTPVSAPTLLPSGTAPPSSPTPVATQTSCFTSANCTATPTRATATPLPRPSATVSMTPTSERTSTAVPSPSPTRVVEPSQTSLPVHASATTTTTPPPRVSSLSATATVVGPREPVSETRGAESAFVILTMLLGGLVILLGGWLSGLLRWPFRRGR